MNKIILLWLIGSALTLTSCFKEGEIKVQNKIGGVSIRDVKWGEYRIAWELLPGETSRERSILEDELPAAHKLSFKMTAKGKAIYLETEEVYSLTKDQRLLIVLADTTKVKNPNQ